MRSVAPAVLPILRSQHQGELLAALLLQPGREYTLTELAANIDAPLTTVQDEVNRLLPWGLIRERRQGRNRLLSANPDNVYAPPLTQLLTISYGPHLIVGEEFAITGVRQVVIFGSWAARYAGEFGPPPRDIDVLVVGTAGAMDIELAADRAEKRLGVPVHPTRCSPEQWTDDTDWLLMREIRARPYTVAFSRQEQR
ncbi:ArsR family transcriptional regulator [Mycobacteroides chelonae]|uniref:ArsR family transcriptional regulator n=1 Tax=Mycobacteroides chelonae TaxID=1774 RepID=A0A1S1LCI6_MYCCH|nr:ArsR family transcriptional regulator [Mycobacteroides chelonae]OHU47373.1 ArsR family transcriptional regulator [Mycobacteroides chelonae]